MQDFCNGTMQLLQGSIDVAASLRCTISPDFVRATEEKLSDNHMTALEAHLGVSEDTCSVGLPPQGTELIHMSRQI